MNYVIIGLLVVVILINIVLVIKVSKKNETSSLTLKDLKDNNEILKAYLDETNHKVKDLEKSNYEFRENFNKNFNENFDRINTKLNQEFLQRKVKISTRFPYILDSYVVI